MTDMTALLIWNAVLLYLMIGVILSRTLFKYAIVEVFDSYPDAETAVALGLAWPIGLIMLILLGLLSLLGHLYRGP